MQVCSGGALTKLLARETPLGEREVATLAHKMLSAIHYCHQHGVVHRDIKVSSRYICYTCHIWRRPSKHIKVPFEPLAGGGVARQRRAGPCVTLRTC